MYTNKELKKLIIPLVIEQILAITVGMVDTMMISNAGEAAVSGVSLVDMLNNLLINIFAALATGGAVVASQYLGKKDEKTACACAGQLLLVSGIFSGFIMGLCLVLKAPLIRLCFGSIEQDVFEAASIYLLISALSYPFLGIYNSCAALFRAMNNSKISMQSSVVMNLINLVGNYIAIFILGWGVAGAAVSTLLSRIIACAILYIRLHAKDLVIHLTFGKKPAVNKNIIRKILHIGIPSGLENSIFQLGRVMVVGIIATFGTTQIAANAIANNLDGMGCIPAQAMNLAMITVVGRCAGAGDEKQTVHYVKKMMKITYLVSALWNIVILATMPLTTLLYQVSAQTRDLAMLLVLIHDGCAIFFWPASFTLPNALRAVNDVKFPMVVSIASMWIFRIGLSYILGLQFGWGALGVWIAMITDWICRSSLFVWRFASGRWKRKMQLV